MSPFLISAIRFLRRIKQWHRNKLSAFTLRFFPDRWRWFEKSRAPAFQKAELQPGSKRVVAIETTDVCNLNCVMCETWSATREKGFMKTEDFIANLSRVQALGQSEITFHTIGDPLMDKNLGEKLQLCYERGIEVDLRTNGLLLHNFIDVLLKSPPARLRLSIDGGTRETYEKIRIRGKFDKLIANLKLLTEAFRKHRILCELGVDMVVFDSNLHEIPIFYQVFHSYFKLCHMHFHVVDSLSGDHGALFANEKLSLFSEPVPPCKMPFSSLFILHDQRVSVCCRDYHEELIVGNLREETLDQIWNGENIKQLQKSHQRAITDPSQLPRACRECFSPSPTISQAFDIFVHRLLQKNISEYGIDHFPIDQMVSEIRAFIDSLSHRIKLLNHHQSSKESIDFLLSGKDG